MRFVSRACDTGDSDLMDLDIPKPAGKTRWNPEVGMVERVWISGKAIYFYEFWPDHEGGWRDRCCFKQYGPYKHRRSAVTAAKNHYRRGKR